MADSITRVDGQTKTPDELKSMIMSTLKPFVINNCIDDWEAKNWSMTEFTELFGKTQTRFKLHKKTDFVVDVPLGKRQKVDLEGYVSMETECVHHNGTFQHFQDWLNGKDNDLSAKYPRNQYWCYADYNYMTELFNNDKTVLDAVDWSIFGFHQRNGHQSTIWIGSEESFTPCHQDTYGLNLVAQIDGVKRWLLLPPSEEKHVRPLRIPYEESSVFSRLNNEKLKRMDKCLQVNLQPGEVLVVPKHWWHFVENLVPSLSINTWIELDSDKTDRLDEALTQTLVYAFNKSNDSQNKNWTNPGQELPSSLRDCLHYVEIAIKGSLGIEDPGVTPEMLVNCLCEKDVLQKVTEKIAQRIKDS